MNTTPTPQTESHTRKQLTIEQRQELNQAANDARKRVSKMSRSEKAELEEAARKKISGVPLTQEEHDKIVHKTAEARWHSEWFEQPQEVKDIWIAAFIGALKGTQIERQFAELTADAAVQKYKQRFS